MQFLHFYVAKSSPTYIESSGGLKVYIFHNLRITLYERNIVYKFDCATFDRNY